MPSGPEGGQSQPTDAISDALARAQPEGIDAELVRHRLMATLFGRRVEAPRFGRFELRERIGQGGMGVVYRAWDPQLERAVAIKLVETAGLDPSLRERALREARSLAKLAHPNVITVYEAGLSDDRVWIAMEYVSGTTLREALARTPRPDTTTILRHWIAVGRGLAAVHAAGLVHRDVKPSNVLMGDDGRARLIDFGLVRGQQREGEMSRSQERMATPELPSGSNTLGTQGFVGTYAYAAPEQLEGGQVDAAADQYSFCVSVWESLCEQRPPSPSERSGALPVPAGTAMPARVHRALARGLATSPKDRFASLSSLLDELEAVVEGPSRRLGLVFGAAALGAVAAGVVVMQTHQPVEAPVCVVDASVLVDTWDDARRARLRERMLASELEFASTTFTTLAAGLDEWSAGWLEARRVACLATKIEGVQSEQALDLRNACLERKRRGLQVTLDTLLTEVDASELVTGAPSLLSNLPRLDDCADPERLALIDPLPVAGPQRDAISRGYDTLTRARAWAAAGSLAQAEAHVDEFRRDVPEASEYGPLRLELDAFPARLELLRGRVARGIGPLLALAREAEARRLDELAASLYVEAATHAAGRWSKPELERWLVDESTVALRRLDRPRDPRRAALRAAEAALLADTGKLDEALAAYEDARALALELGDAPRAEAQRLHIGAMLASLGRFEQARGVFEAGLAEAERRWGSSAPEVGIYESDLANLALETGEFELAGRRLDRAEAIFRAAFGPDSLRVARVRFARAKLDMLAGEFTTALSSVDAAKLVYARELGEDHELLAELHEARGVLCFFTGDLPGSIAAYEAALRITAAVNGPDHPSNARLYSNLGESQAALGRLDLARASFDRALTTYARTLPADHPELALPLKGRGQAALAMGRVDEACEDLERALDLQVRAGSEPLEIADLRFSLARALRERDGRATPRAKLLAQQARDEFTKREMTEPIEAIDAWLAE